MVSLFLAFLCAVWARELWVQATALAQQNEMMMFLKVRLAPFVYVMSALTTLTAVIMLVQGWLKLTGRFTPLDGPGV